MAYKKLLSIFEIDALVNEHRESPVFRTNRKGERTLEPWLKTLRFRQAHQVAERLLGTAISEEEFQACWKRTREPRPKRAPSETPNTSTFGGYRLGQRSALNRDKKQEGHKKKR